MSPFELCGRFGGAFALADDRGSHLGRPLELTVSMRPSEPLAALLWRRAIDVTGEIDAAGWADRQPFEGTVGLEGVTALAYLLLFENNHGRRCRFQGRQQLSLRGRPAAVTVLSGKLETPEGSAIGRALLRMDLRSEVLRRCQ